MNQNILIQNLDKLHTTKLGVDRIKNNLKLDHNDIVAYCTKKILENNCHIYRQGKNWYCEIDNIRITVNAASYTIITAKKFRP